MRNLKSYLKYLSYAFTAFILGLLVFSAIDYAQGTQPFFVVSDNPSSMSPTIDYGDAVMVYKVSFNSLHAGDIIVFKDPRGGDQTIVHRIAAIEGNGSSRCLLTKGDNDLTNPTIDPWKVTDQYYISKVVVVVPVVGYISPSLWGTTGMLVVAAIVGIALFLLLFAPSKNEAEGNKVPQEAVQGGEPKS